MSSVSRAIAVFTGVSLTGTVTQVIKGKVTTVLLGAEGVGVLDQLIRIPNAMVLGATMGTYGGLIRHMSAYNRDGNSEAMRAHFATTALVVIALSLIFAVAGALTAPWLSDTLFADEGERAGLIALAMLIVPLSCLGWCYRVALNVAKDVRALARSRIIADVSSVVILVLMAWLFGLWGAVLGYIALHTVFFCTTWAYVRRLQVEHQVDFAYHRFEWAELRRNFRFGAAGLLVTIAQMGAALIVARCIIVEQGLASNGLYAMALKVSSVYLGGLSAAAGGYVFPALSNATNQIDFDNILNEALVNGLIIVVPIAAMIMFTGEVLMRLLFSAEFIPAAFLLLIMLPGDLFRLSSETLESALSSQGCLAMLIGLRVGWAVAYAGVAIISLPHFGILGAAAAYLGSHLLRTTFAVPFAMKGTNWRPSTRVWKIGIAGLALLALTSATVIFAPSWTLRIAIGLTALGLWLLAVWKDPIVLALFHHISSKFPF